MPICTTGAGGIRSWNSGLLSGLTYFLPSPTSCFTDAGTTPAAVGDSVHDFVSTYGTYRFRQTTAGQRPILRQTAGGKYYLEFATSRNMSGTTNFTPALNEPFTIAISFNPVTWNDGLNHAYVALGSAATGQYRSVWQNAAGKLNYDTYAQARIADQPDGTVNQSIITSTATGATVQIYRNNVALSMSGPSSHAAGSAAVVRLGHDSGLYTGNWNAYGFGWGAFDPTSDQRTSLDSYQQSLY